MVYKRAGLPVLLIKGDDDMADELLRVGVAGCGGLVRRETPIVKEVEGAQCTTERHSFSCLDFVVYDSLLFYACRFLHAKSVSRVFKGIYFQYMCDLRIIYIQRFSESPCLCEVFIH